MGPYLVEFLGTMFIVFIVLATNSFLALNPAVAVGLYASGKLEKSKLLAYIIVEILGALAGFYAYNIFVSNSTNKE